MNNQIKRLELGIKKIFKKPILALYPIFFIIVHTFFTLFCKWNIEQKNSPLYSPLFVCIFMVFMIEIAILGIAAIITLIGTPKNFRAIENAFIYMDICDKKRKPPVLVSYKKVGKCYEYVFYSNKIALRKFEDKTQEIENILNIKIMNISYGKDMQHIVIKALNRFKNATEILPWNDEYISEKDFEIVLGEDYSDKISIDLNLTPHTLLGGGTSSGKTTLLKLMLYQCYKKGAEIYIADFKGGIDYPLVWRNKFDIITTTVRLNKVLTEMISTMEKRRELLINSKASNISEYNKISNLKMKRIVIACDEIAEVLDKTGLSKEEKYTVYEIENKLSTIARQGRAFGIHLILATQRPDSEILKGQIKINLGNKICGRADKILSQIILDNSEAAEKISSKDQGLFLSNFSSLFKAYYITDNQLVNFETESVIKNK